MKISQKIRKSIVYRNFSQDLGQTTMFQVSGYSSVQDGESDHLQWADEQAASLFKRPSTFYLIYLMFHGKGQGYQC